MKKEKFEIPVCEHCGQTTEVLYSLDHGTADLVKAVLVRIKLKGENKVHLRDEMEINKRDWTYTRLLNEGMITSTMAQNCIRAHKHGLLAQVKGETGVWCLTRKGAAFLRGGVVPKFVIQDKRTKRITGYWKPEKYTITVDELKNPENPYWEKTSFDVIDGRLVVPSAFEIPQASLFV